MDEDGKETAEELHFFYDAQSRPAFVEYEGEMYRYIHNLQGDVVAIVDDGGNIVVEYKYDAWGKTIYEAGGLLSSLGDLNPFRYRGYVFDYESELYYLMYRYYSAVKNRFLNLDEFGGSKGKIISHNVYCYCMNSPVCQKDEMGRAGGWALGLLLIVLVGGLSGCSTEDYSGAANCYAYALKQTVDPKTGQPFTKKPNPGSFSGNPLSNSDLKKMDVKKEIISRVETDCTALNLTIEEVGSNAYICEDGEWLIALAFAPDYDYHWYRKDEDGTWSHKPGVTAVSRVDQSRNIIYDPQKCDRGEYYEFMGYFAISPR